MRLVRRLIRRVAPTERKAPAPVGRPSDYEWWLSERLTELAEAGQEFMNAYGVLIPKLFGDSPPGREESRRLGEALWAVEGAYHAARDYDGPVEAPWDGFEHDGFVKMLATDFGLCWAIVVAVGEGDVAKAARAQGSLVEIEALEHQVQRRLTVRILEQLPASDQRDLLADPSIQWLVSDRFERTRESFVSAGPAEREQLLQELERQFNPRSGG